MYPLLGKNLSTSGQTAGNPCPACISFRFPPSSFLSPRPPRFRRVGWVGGRPPNTPVKSPQNRARIKSPKRRKSAKNNTHHHSSKAARRQPPTKSRPSRKQAKAPYRLGGMASPQEPPPAKARPRTASGAITSPTGKSKPRPRQARPASPHNCKPKPRTASGAITSPTGRASPAATSTASKPGPLQAPTGIPRKSPAPVPPLAT